MFENQTNLVSTKVFSFLDFKLALMQAMFNSWQPSPNFFGQIMHFCKFAWVDLIDKYFKFLQTLSSIVAYCTLWKKHDQNRFPKSFIPNLKLHI
jgi:hypothetical protein